MKKILIILIFIISSAQADWMDYSFKIEKNEKRESLLITPFGVYNRGVFSSKPVDVRLKDGTEVRVKMGLGAVYPYGEGGGDPDKFISIWVDKVKVISKKSLFITSEGTSHKIEVTPKGYWFHQFDIDWFKVGEKISSEFVPKEKYPSEVDFIEFPNEKNKPNDGEVVFLHCDNERLKKMILNTSLRRSHSYVSYPVQPPDESLSIEEFDKYKDRFNTKIFNYAYSGHVRHFVADIDNDGNKDFVYALFARTHYRDGDVYFIFDKEQDIDGNITDKDIEMFFKKANKIFPNSWVESHFSFKSEIDTWWTTIKNPKFELRYLCLWPFIYKEKFYFILGSREERYNNWFAILRVDGKELREELIGQKVKPHY